MMQEEAFKVWCPYPLSFISYQEVRIVEVGVDAAYNNANETEKLAALTRA